MQGDDIAQLGLGILYANGLGVTQDYVIIAKEWVEKGCDKYKEPNLKDY